MKFDYEMGLQVVDIIFLKAQKMSENYKCVMLPSLARSSAIDSYKHKATTKYDSYVWSIPSMSCYEKAILCDGYVKRNYNKYVTTAIIELFAYYYTNDDFGFADIINAKHKQKFVSPIFAIKNFKFYLEIYPNGSNSATKGEVILYICLAMLPTKLSKITAQFQLTLKQTNTIYRDVAAFSSDDSYGGWPRHTLPLTNLINATSDKLQFILDMNIINVFDQTQNIIPNYIDKCNIYQTTTNIKYLPVMTYHWNISDKESMSQLKKARVCQQFNGPLALAKIKSLGWYLRFYPNGASNKNAGKMYIGLKVLYWPSDLSKMLVQCKLTLNQLKISKSGPKCFDTTHLSLSWNTTQMADVLQNLSHISFTMQLKIVDMLDQDGISIINDYIDQHQFRYCYASTAAIWRYEWQIYDQVVLDKISTAKMGDTFNSKLFEVGPFSMYLQFRPTVTDGGKVWLGLKLSHLPSKIAQLVCKCKLVFHQGDNFKTGYKCFQDNHLGFAMNTKITKEILVQLKQLTFCVEISILDVIHHKQYEIEKKDYMIFEHLAIDGINIIDKMSKLPMIAHKWVISDPLMVDQLKHASNVHCCVSPIFSAFKFKWYIGFWPNGSRESRAGHINVYLNCTSFMSATLIVVVRYTLTLQNIQTNTFYHAFSKDKNCWGRVKWMPLTKNIHCLDTFNFAANVELIAVYEDGEVITDRFVDDSSMQSKSIVVPSQITEWIILVSNHSNDIYVNGEAIYSPHFSMHDMQFYLSLYANGKSKSNEGNVEICIDIIQLPSKNAIVCLRYMIFVKETDTRYCAATTFCADKLVETWGHERISTDRFKELDKMTVEFRMDLIDIYENGINITKRVAPMDYYEDRTLYQIKKNIENLETLTKKLKLINRAHGVGETKHIGNKNKSLNTIKYADIDALFLWLRDDVGLEQYYIHFVNHGVTAVSIIKCITDNDLQAMGITLLQHRVRIIIEIANLMIP